MIDNRTKLIAAVLIGLLFLGGWWWYTHRPAVDSGYLQSEAYSDFQRQLSREDSLRRDEEVVFRQLAARIAGASRTELRLPFSLDSASVGRYLLPERQLRPEVTGLSRSSFANDRFYRVGYALADRLKATLFIRQRPSVYGQTQLFLAVTRDDSLRSVRQIGAFGGDPNGSISTRLRWDTFSNPVTEVVRIRRYPLRQRFGEKQRWHITVEGEVGVGPAGE